MLRIARGHPPSGSTAASFARLGKHRAAHQRWRARVRWQSAVAETLAAPTRESHKTLALPSEARYNEIGVQHLSSHMYDQIFHTKRDTPLDAASEAEQLRSIQAEVTEQDQARILKEQKYKEALVELSKDHLRRHDLLGKNTRNLEPIAFDLPKLQGETMDEHFYKLGVDAAEPFLTNANLFAKANAGPRPREWKRQSGWTKYYPDGSAEKIDVPDEKMLCFDTEVMWKESPFAVMACAAGPTAWYAWLSPWLLGETKNEKQLIPLGDPTEDRIVVGHNIGYDRARILEEYSIEQTRNLFLDTMSLHVAVNGMCSQQRPTWMKHKKNRELRDKIAQETDSAQLATLLGSDSLSHDEEELWVGRSSINSLRDVAKFHLNVTIDKAIRNDFGELDRAGILSKLDDLLDYCAADVSVTHLVFQKVFPNFLKVCPHPVSFAALRHLSTVILPVNESWDAYIANSEATYHMLNDAVQERLLSLTKKALELKDDADQWRNDPWLKQLDWSGQEVKMVKGKKKGEEPRPSLAQKMPGMPKWYKDLHPKKDGPINLTVRTRVAPLLLRLSWDGNPLFWSDKYGWTYRVPVAEKEIHTAKQLVLCDLSDDTTTSLKEDREGVYFKIPHKNGPLARCVNPMAKSYLSYFEKGTLTSEFAYAKEALEMNASCSYWISARDRIKSQLVVYKKDLPEATEEVKSNKQGFILPQVIPMGTVTRRAVENTWLTASNAKNNRVGSELKAMVQSPPGYCFVGADVDSEELWIASLIGDSTFKLHGGNAIGFMTLEGTKAAGTDLHSRTASILGITRNDAKVFNYGRIYGAGLKFAGQLLRQFNPSLTEKETAEIASKLYVTTKGIKTTKRQLSKQKFWRGGTESFVFNKLEEFAEQEKPRTPVLGAGITEALMSRYVSRGGFLTSRINWAIQSSGVDYLHLLIVSMDYLIRRFNIQARLAITVHDEIRYLVKNEDKYRAAMALQVSNLWTRVMFAQQVGINDLPQSCAYFSAVDIDHVLRKEVDMACITPSHKTPIQPGESIDIAALLAKGDAALLDESIIPEVYAPIDMSTIPYTPRTPVMDELRAADVSAADLSFIKAQITADEKELRDILAEKRKAVLASAPPKPKPTKPITPYYSYPHLLHMDEPMLVGDALKTKQYGGYDNKKFHNQSWERNNYKTSWKSTSVRSGQ